MYGNLNFNVLEGLVLSEIKQIDNERLVFITDKGREFSMFHDQDCCESVTIDDICGDLKDLIGSPILLAEEVSNEPIPPFEDDYIPESYTWTFYKISTFKGSVTIRWFGSSNGYYSESVNFEETT